MPIYVYRCNVCSGQFDLFFKSMAVVPTQVQCSICHATQVDRLMSAPVVRNGSGAQGVELDAPTTAPKPAILGRRELNEALKSKTAGFDD